MKKIFIDTETGGLNPFINPCLEIGIIIEHEDGGLEFFDRYVDGSTAEHHPSFITQEALSVNGIVPGNFPDVALTKTAIQLFFENAGVTRKNAVFIAQNAPFDKGFLQQVIGDDLNIPYHWVDCVSLSWLLYGDEEGFSASKDKIAIKLGLEAEQKPHKALNGAKHLRLVFNRLVEQLKKEGKCEY